LTLQQSQSSQDKIVLKITPPADPEEKIVPAKRPYKKTLKLVASNQQNEESKGGASATEEAKLSKDHKETLRL
jgi:hypothetical protein